MKIARTFLLAFGVFILGLVLLVPLLMTGALVVLVLAKINPVLGFIILVVAVAVYRVASDWKPKWFLE